MPMSIFITTSDLIIPSATTSSNFTDTKPESSFTISSLVGSSLGVAETSMVSLGAITSCTKV